MKAKRLDPAVFKDAATAILKGDHGYCCCALDWREQSDFGVDGPHLQYFERHFKPEVLRLSTGQSSWWGNKFAPELEYTECREARILALLLCAEMCKR